LHPLGRRDVVAAFDGGRISSDAGAVLLRELEQRTGIIRRFAGCFVDHRDPDLKTGASAASAPDLALTRLRSQSLGPKDPRQLTAALRLGVRSKRCS
jgi:hypothetical protein